ncbi:MAG: HEAT repeat domain-containing protein, partial [Acidobacteriota bacterium]
MRLSKLVLLIGIVFCFSPVAFSQAVERSVDGLVYDLQHPDPERRKESARILGQNRVREAVPALIKLTEDSDSSVRLEAAKALVEIDDSRALQAFIRLTRDPSPATQKVAIQGIVDIYVTPEGGFVQGVLKVVDFVNPLSDGYDPRIVESYVPVSADAVRALGDMLFFEDRSVRQSAATALGILRGKGASTAIRDAIEKEDNNGVKVELIRAVYKMGDAAVGEYAVPLIRDPDKKVHDEAVLTVGRLKVQKAAPQLNELYGAGIEEQKKLFGFVPVTGKDDFQKKVLEALAFIGDPSSSEILEDALADEREFYRRFGAEGLGRIGDTSYVNLVARNYLRESSKSVKLAMTYAL